MSIEDKYGDQRLKKSAGSEVRGSRDASDVERTQDGGVLSPEERRRLLRQEHIQEVLPTPPKLPGMHCCWLSTTNSTDPIYKRVQRGYLPVKAAEVPGYGGQFTVMGGEFDGCIRCNEMLLFKISDQTYQDLMMIFHHDMPLEQEATIRDKLEGNQEYDSSGRPLAQTEGGFDNLGRSPDRNPSFI